MAPSHSFKAYLLSSLLCLAPTQVLGQASSGLTACLQAQGLDFATASDTTWTTATTQLQQRVPRDPTAVVFAQDRDDVAAALACGRNASVKVSALNRGHSFQGYGLGNPGNLIIDLKKLNSISFDAATNELIVGGGTNVGPSAKFLWDNHRRHFPHVRASHVGMLGSMMGVGFGTTTRMLGTPMDQLASVEVMLANGTVVTAGPGSDLLWAIQGAGASFGIALSARVKTHEVPFDGGLNYTIAFGSTPPSNEAMTSVVLAIQKLALANQVPNELSLRVNMVNNQILGMFYGTEVSFNNGIKPLIDALRAIVPETTVNTLVQPNFWETEIISHGPGMNSATGGSLGAGRFSYTQSWVSTLSTPLNADQARKFVDAYRGINRTDLRNSGFLDLWTGAQIRKSDSETSALQAKNLWLIRNDGISASGWPTDGVAYMQGLFKPFADALKTSGPLRSFVNYADSELPVSDWSARLYGRNWGKLQKIKAAVDPTQVFSGYGHAVTLARRRRN